MSKSYNNYIDIFLPEKKLRKQIMGIVTDSTPLEEPKDWQSCNVFKLYQLLASPSQTSDLQSQYEAGNFGYGHANRLSLSLLWTPFLSKDNALTT